MDVDTDPIGPRIRAHPDRDGVQIVDPIQETQFVLLTPDTVDPVDCDPDRFYFPAEVGASVPADTVETAYLVFVWIRDDDGNLVAEMTEAGSRSLPPGIYNVELSTTQMTVQLAVEGGLTVEVADDRTRISVEEGARIHVGARSVHEQPAATVTTTADPRDVMDAVSTLGSALKTTSSERSFPTLRGHPPLIERGSELSIPDRIESPDAGVTIEIPPSLEYVYPVTPLAYYLGATVEPGPVPRLVTDDWQFPLNVTGDFESTVERVLKQVLLLDCVVRTEGYYQVDLAERETVEEAVDPDPASLYGRPLAERLETYLDVRYESLTDAIPTWKLTADVRPEIDHVSALPFLANELAIVRCPPDAPRSSGDHDWNSQPVEPTVRTDPETLVRGGNASVSRSKSSMEDVDEQAVRPSDAASIEQAYVGEGVPIGAGKMTVESYYRRLDYEPSDDPRIRVLVVCNDEEMSEENAVSDIYGTRDWFDFDIVFKERLTTSELRDALQTDVDLFHYIGHVDEEGFRCPDGYLDVRRLSDVAVSTFLLNACDSYEQGRALIRSGAMTGIATVTDVINEAATSVGRTVAKLLNQGYPMAATVDILKKYEQIGHHYIVIGDGSTAIVENKSGTPHRVVVRRREDQTCEISLFGYPTLNAGIGTIFAPQIPDISEFHLNSGQMGRYRIPEESLLDFIHKQELPVELDGELEWSTDISDLS